jgi:D-serine deaminase-like pyridoxal phosphate-dependent protein
MISNLNINKPSFVVDKQICLANIEKMAKKASERGIRFRPHFKTHQSADIGEWFRMFGVEAITVSSVSMAEYFAAHGWKDITIAFPVNILEINEINRLASEIKLSLLVENEITMSFLKRKLTASVGIWIEIDTGYHRTGIDVLKTRRIDQILNLLKNDSLMNFKGFLSHSGQTYSAPSREDIINRHADVLMKMRSLKKYYQTEWPDLEISLGDTPACSVCDDWNGVDEIRPGNFVFYDLMQLQLGTCQVDEIAVKVICPVVSKSIMRNEVVIYGGAVHLSKEFITGPNGKRSYGAVISINPETLRKEISEDTRVAALSQEHGIITGTFEDIKRLQPGDLIEIIPVHSCLAADLAGYYITTVGERLNKMGKTESYEK